MATTKEPWEMTQREYLTMRERWLVGSKAQSPELYYGNLRPDDSRRVWKGTMSKYHLEHIEQALKESKPVPTEVLMDYPELGKKESRTLGGGDVTDIGSADKPIVSPYGLPAYRKDGFWYFRGYSMTGSGKLGEWARVTDPQSQEGYDALYPNKEAITKAQAQIRKGYPELVGETALVEHLPVLAEKPKRKPKSRKHSSSSAGVKGLRR